MKLIRTALIGALAAAGLLVGTPAGAAPALHLPTPALASHDASGPVLVHHRRHGGHYGNRRHGNRVSYGPIRVETTRHIVRRHGPYRVVKVCDIKYRNAHFWRHGRRHTERHVLNQRCEFVRVFRPGHRHRGGLSFQFTY